jgi:hypothetical protein
MIVVYFRKKLRHSNISVLFEVIVFAFSLSPLYCDCLDRPLFDYYYFNLALYMSFHALKIYFRKPDLHAGRLIEVATRCHMSF